MEDTKPEANGVDATSSNNLGLSELSKQLRALQSKNQSQATEIDRLERKIRILGDLKGISIGDLQNALRSACEGEAFAEMLDQISSLRFQLDANVFSSGTTTSEDFDRDSSSRTIAMLQLRIGELEEVEGGLKAEIGSLYDSLREEKAKCTRLNSKNKLLKSQCAEHEEQLKQEKKKMKKKLLQRVDEVKEKTAVSLEKTTASFEELKEKEDSFQQEIESLMQKEDTYKQDIDVMRVHMQEMEQELQVEKENVQLMRNEADARMKETQLRNDQVKYRFESQDERIKDLEQQLSSLYQAFEMLQAEQTEETLRRSKLEKHLHEADSKVASQLHTEMENQLGLSSPALRSVRMTTNEHMSASTPVIQIPFPLNQTTPRTNQHQSVASLPVTMPASTPDLNGPTTPRLTSFISTARRSSSTGRGGRVRLSESFSEVREEDKLVSGYLWKRDKSGMKGWKKRWFFLAGCDGIYHIRYSDGPKTKIKGELGPIKKGVSTVHQTMEFPNKPFCFVIHVGGHQDPEAPSLYAAASNNQDIVMWLFALRVATGAYQPKSSSSVNPASLISSNKDEQEEKDREMALMLANMD
jgi:chromosome segregation ATPase